MSNVLVAIEHQDNELRGAALPAVSFANQAAELTGGDVIGLVLGEDVGHIADEIAQYELDKVVVADDETFQNYLSEPFAEGMAEAANEYNAEIVCAPSSAQGSDFLPRTAVELEAGMVTNAIDVWEEDSTLLFKRPVWSGSLLKTEELITEKKVVSVRTTDFDDAPKTDEPAGVEQIELSTESRSDVEFAGLDLVESERPELTDADVVIAGGRGLESADAFDMLEELADLFKGAVGASRAAVDNDYAPQDWQIGQTGKVVAPNLYFAIAISGAIQHLSGMKGSKNIVAINTDPDAPIFEVSDYGLVEDAFKAVPELIEKLKAKGFGS
jgi:electron transfer flavoprotein alpha subunit